jgi:hypothetical protein
MDLKELEGTLESQAYLVKMAKEALMALEDKKVTLEIEYSQLLMPEI